MKKFITKISAVAIVSASLFGASAFAKTEGTYVGVDILRASAETSYKGNQNNPPIPFSDSGSTSLGLNVKHAINLNNFFIAPGVFYERIDTSTVANQDNHERFSVSNRYGAKIDLGYDVNENVAIYFTNGLAHVRAKQDWSTNGDGVGGALTSNEGNTSYFYGIGLLNHFSDSFTVGAEYNTQTFRTDSLGDVNGIFVGQRVKTKLDVYKITLSYRF